MSKQNISTHIRFIKKNANVIENLVDYLKNSNDGMVQSMAQEMGTAVHWILRYIQDIEENDS